MMSGDLKIITDFCQQYDMLPRGCRVLACVSGGADSMCLLDVLSRLAPELGFSVTAAHFNHNLRGAESDGDEAFVREYCAAVGVPVLVGSGDVAGEAARRGKGTEETARDMRYSFFRSAADECGAARIATAHNADDNLETILLHLARGSGLRGLGGIPPVRGDIIRPLLPLTRAEIEEYDAARNIPWRLDSTNLSDDCSRNALRHHVLPVLRGINPRVSAAALGTSELLREDDAYLDSLALDFVREHAASGRVPVSELVRLPRPISSRAVRILWGAGLTKEHVAAVMALALSPDPSARLSLPALTLRREYGYIVPDGGDRSFSPLPLALDRHIIIDGSGIELYCEKTVAENEIYNSLTTFLIKCDNIRGELSVRPRMTGDSIRLPGRNGSKSLKKLFIERRIPAARRGLVPVIADEEGVLAVFGIGCDIRALPQVGDDALKITIKEKEND